MVQRFLCLLIWLALVACEPFDLTKKDFPVCVKPSATIGYTIGLLDVTFFLDNPQGDIGSAGWDPGDGRGINRVGSRVTYTYAKAGTYTVTLTIANSCDDKFTTTRQITVHN
jgi:PKD repeat protein